MRFSCVLSLTHFSDAQIGRSHFKVQCNNCFQGKLNAAFLKENYFIFVREVIQLVVAKTVQFSLKYFGGCEANNLTNKLLLDS